MKKKFDCVKMMREIRDVLGKRYANRDVERKELAEIRKKYAIAD